MGDNKFKEYMQKILKKIKICNEERAKFLQHTKIIANEIITTLSKRKSVFGNALVGLENTASYKRDMTVDFPEDFTFYLLLNMPFEISPNFTSNSLRVVRLATSVTHPIVINGYISADIFSDLFREDFQNAIEQIKFVNCTNDTKYALSYKTQELAHRIVYHHIQATAVSPDGTTGAHICFDFLPAFQLPVSEACLRSNGFYCIAFNQFDPMLDRNNFMYILPRTQMLPRPLRLKGRNVLRLLRTIAISNQVSHLFNAAILKSAYTWRIQLKCHNCFITKSTADIFMEFLRQIRLMMFAFVPHALSMKQMYAIEKLNLYRNCARFDFFYNKLNDYQRSRIDYGFDDLLELFAIF